VGLDRGLEAEIPASLTRSTPEPPHQMLTLRRGPIGRDESRAVQTNSPTNEIPNEPLVASSSFLRFENFDVDLGIIIMRL